jgi:hypothetical protein
MSDRTADSGAVKPKIVGEILKRIVFHGCSSFLRIRLYGFLGYSAVFACVIYGYILQARTVLPRRQRRPVPTIAALASFA